MKPTSNESDSDDISLISEDEDSEALKGSSTGPKTWSEVDESKLRTLSSRLSQLILGSKSSQTLPSITSSSEIKSIGQQGDLHTTSKYGVEEGLSNSDLDKAKFLNKLASLYQGVSWDDLVQDFELLRSDFTESADQMKSLIKEHFQHFIVIQDATNDILTRMTALEMEVDELGVHGATATDVQESITRSIQLSKDVFDSMLQRNERKQNISRMLNALGQYDALVTLPSQIRESAESEDFEMVIQLYRKAGSFVDGARSVEDPSAKQMWDKLRMEVNTVSLLYSYFYNNLPHTMMFGSNMDYKTLLFFLQTHT